MTIFKRKVKLADEIFLNHVFFNCYFIVQAQLRYTKHLKIYIVLTTAIVLPNISK